MLIKAEHPAVSTTNSSVAMACSNCGVEDRLLLHHVRHGGNFHRLCTTCVLRLHTQSFCPTCFLVYPPPPSNDAVLTCFKCYSSSHSRCVAAPPSPYICPLCVNPHTPIFKLKTVKEVNIAMDDGLTVKNEECRVMDREAAKKLLAAAKIASASMNKAAAAAIAEAERRAKESALSRKRAREALEHVAYLVMKEKLRKKEAVLALSGEVAGSGLSGVGVNVGYAGGCLNMAKLNRENNVNIHSSRNAIVGSSVGPSVIVDEKMNTIGNLDREDNSNQVLAALNAVELRENEKKGGLTGHGAASGMALNDDLAVVDVDEKRRILVNARGNVGGFAAEKNNGSDSDHVMFADMEIGAENLNMQGIKQDVNNEVVLVHTVADQMHYKDSKNEEQHANVALL